MYIAVLGDCTGHGVPGAVLVSMGISFLYQIIDSHDCELMPDTILTQLREKVISSFGVDKDGAMRSDGMDVAVVVYDTETKETFFSGAQRPAVLPLFRRLHRPSGRRTQAQDYVETFQGKNPRILRAAYERASRETHQIHFRLQGRLSPNRRHRAHCV